jgi:NADH-quinone oxidoreductase subunit J
MSLEMIFFIGLSALTLGSAIGVILSRNSVYSVLFLILTFFAISGHYILMNAQFLAIVNIIVYAGAIMVLFLFVIMLMNLNKDTEPQKSSLIQLAGVISGGCLLLLVVMAFRQAGLEISGANATTTSLSNIGLIKVLGKKLFTDYVFPFEISSVLFLSAMIGTVVLGKKDNDMAVVAD